MVTLISFPIITAPAPFLFDFDPINRCFKNIIPDIFRQICASCTYAILSLFGVIIVGPFLLILLTGIYSFEVITRNLLKLTNSHRPNMSAVSRKPHISFCTKFQHHICNRVFSLKTVKNRTLFIKVTERRSIENASFKRIFFQMKCLQIIFQSINHILSEFTTTIFGIDIAFCVLINVGCVILYDREELRFVWLALLTLVPCFYCINCLFVRQTAMPLINTQLVLFCWKEKLVDKVERRQLKSLVSCGFNLGPFFKFKRATVLDILNTVMDYTTSLLLSINN